MSLKYGIIGVGGLGGYYGGRLAKAGKDVHFLLHSDFDFVKNNGLKVDSVNGDFELAKVNAYGDAIDMPKCDVIIVCLKTNNNHLLSKLLAPLLKQDSVVILLQNGLGIEQEVADLFPEVNLAGALAYICSYKAGPGHICHLDLGKLNLGSFNLKNLDCLKQVSDDFNDAEVPCSVSDNLYALRWQKLIWNITFNGMSVVLNAETDELVNTPETCELSRQLMLEVIHAAQHCGVDLKESVVESMIDMTKNMKVSYAPSMKLDFDFKRPMEIKAIYSNPVKEAALHGFDMTRVAMLEKQLQFIAKNKY